MDHFVPAAIAEDRFDLGAAASCYALRIRRMVGHQPTREFASLRIAHNHGVAALERAFDRADACRQQALAVRQRARGTCIDDKRSLNL